MQDLTVVGVERGSLLLASEVGERFRVAVDESLQSRLRHTAAEPPARRISPRDIQAHIRGGLSAEEVAEVLDVAVDDVRRYEGPVLAEREHIVGAALSVLVHTAIDPEPLDEESRFGSVIRARLASLGATGERWTSWKEPEGGWTVKLSFTADGIDHDARWAFEPKKRSLTPANPEATTLSRQGELPSAMLPRLRAVTADGPDTTRFDSGAFALRSSEPGDSGPVDPLPYGRRAVAPTQSAAPRANESTGAAAMSQTADLLEALRRRRGEREAAGHGEEEAALPLGAPTLDVPVDPPVESVRSAHPSSGRSARRGRAAMPTWDEIVFGARSDDDPA